MPFKHGHTSSNSSCSPTKDSFVDESLKVPWPHGLFHRLGGNNSNLNLTADTMERPLTPVSLHAPPMASANTNVSSGSTNTTAPRIRAQLGHLLPRHAYFQAEVQVHQLFNVPLVRGEFAVRWKFKGVQAPSGSKPGLLNRVKAKAKAEKERKEGKMREDVTLPTLGGIISPSGGAHSIHSPVQRSASGSQSITPSLVAPSVSSRSSYSSYSQPSNTDSNITSSTNNTLFPSDLNDNTPTSSTLFPSQISSSFTTSTTQSSVSMSTSSTPARGTTEYLPLKDHSVTWSYVLSPVLKMDIDRETHDLLPCPLKLIVLQKIDEEDAKMKGSSSNPQLGVVDLNLAEYVDKDGEDDNGDGRKKKKNGKDGFTTGVERSYLLKESKTNATLKLTVRLTFLHGESNYIAPPLPQGGILTGIAGFLKQNDATRKRPRALVLDIEESTEMQVVDGDGSVTAKTLRNATLGIGMMPGTPRSIGSTMIPPRTARTLGGYGDAPFTPIPPALNSSMPISARVPRILHNITQEDEGDDYSHTISVLSPITGRPLPRRSTAQNTSGTYTSSSSPSASSPSQSNSPVFTSPSRRVIYGSPKAMSPQLSGISPLKPRDDLSTNTNADLALSLLAVDIHRLPAPGFGNGLGSRTKATEALIDAIFNPIAVRASPSEPPPLIRESEFTTIVEEERIRRRYETPFVRYEESVDDVLGGAEESDGTTDTEGDDYREAGSWSDAEGEQGTSKVEPPDTAKPPSPTTARPGVQAGGRATRWILRKKVTVNVTALTSESLGPEPGQRRHVRRNTRDSNSDASNYSVSTGTSNNTASSGSRRNSEDAGFGRRRHDLHIPQDTSSSQGHDSGYEIMDIDPPHNGSAYHLGEEGQSTASHPPEKSHHLGASMRDWWKRHAGARPGTPTGIKA